MQDDVDDFLMHFGVKGMRWGVVKSEPTSGTTSSSKAVVKGNATVPAKTTHLASPTKADKGEGRRGLSSNQKKMIIGGAAVAVGLLAAYGAYKYQDSGQLGQTINRGREFVTGKKFAFKVDKNLAKPMSADQIMKNVVPGVNPGYGGYGTKANCRRSTFAYEMRRRGYDVHATRSVLGAGQSQVGFANALDPKSNLPTHGFKMYKEMALEDYRKGKNPKLTTPIFDLIQSKEIGKNTIKLPNDYSANPIRNAKVIFEALAGQPPGARGELNMNWSVGGSHSMAWEMIRGEVHIFDAQTRKHYKTPKAMNEFAEYIKDAGFTRLDNVELNENFLQRWITNA